MVKSNNDSLIAMFLLFIIVGFGLYMSAGSFTKDKQETYYNFNKVDLLNVSNVGIIEHTYGGENSLLFSKGYDTSNGSSNVYFNTDFGVNMTNITEYNYEFSLSFKNLNLISEDEEAVLDTLNFEADLTKDTEDNNNYTLIGQSRGDIDIVIRNNMITDGADLMNTGSIGTDSQRVKISLDVNLEDNYILNTYEIQNLKYVRFTPQNGLINRIGNPNKAHIVVGRNEHGDDMKLLSENSSVTLDYFKLTIMK